MSVYQDRKQALEESEFRMGLERGRLAVTLDLLTDALVLVGQHGVYCQSARQPGKPRWTFKSSANASQTPRNWSRASWPNCSAAGTHHDNPCKKGFRSFSRPMVVFAP